MLHMLEDIFFVRYFLIFFIYTFELSVDDEVSKKEVIWVLISLSLTPCTIDTNLILLTFQKTDDETQNKNIFFINL